jgi:uncharacterized protein YfeS
VKPALTFYLMAKAYDCYGSHSSLSLIPEFLLTNTPEFGAAIVELTVVFHFRTSGPPRSSLERLYAEHHSGLKTLPKVIFHRSRQQASIGVCSALIDGDDWNPRIKRGPSLSLFKAGVAETIGAIQMLKSRISSKDDFRLDLFLDHCEKRKPHLPTTDQDFVALIEVLRKQKSLANAALSPWERLGIDFRDFHAGARQILDEPFFWEQANDFSPHGNDTGADLLADYRKWLKSHSNSDPLEFYNLMAKRWGLSLVGKSDAEQTMLDEAAVALAFAEVKLRGACRPTAVALAKSAIKRQREQALSAVKWTHRDDRLKSLDAIESKLLSLA